MSFGGNCRRTAGAPPARFRAAWLALIVLALGLPAAGSGQNVPLDAGADSSDIAASVTLPASGQQEVLPAVSEPFRAGESLRFSVQYGGIRAGAAYLEVPQLTDWKGSPAYTLVARAESNSFVSHFYKVRNRIESVWDKRGRFSWRYSETRREGGNKVHDQIVFRTRFPRSTTRASRRCRSAAAWFSTTMPATRASRSKCACWGAIGSRLRRARSTAL